MDLSTVSALVTGAASGLGEASARALAARGATVVLADRDRERLPAVASSIGGSAVGVECDVTDEDGVRAAVARAAELGRFAAVVHCAGGGIASRLLGRDGPHDLEAFRRVIDLNLVGSFNVVRLAAAAMSENEPDADGERGAIVMTASIAGYEGQIGQIAYGSAKAGVIGMTIIAARDLASRGIRVNTIAPGTFLTPPMAMVPDSMREGFEAAIPFPKRFGRPEEYGSLAVHLLENGYLNGEVVRIDGAIRFQPK